jgi:Pyruvate/2-oxoacid:ferredoxin oxidoreductase gamma subunit
VAPAPTALDPSVRCVGVPCSQIALELGTPLVKNLVALGALQALTGLLPEVALLAEIRRAMGGKGEAIRILDEEAFRRGQRAATEATRPAGNH